MKGRLLLKNDNNLGLKWSTVQNDLLFSLAQINIIWNWEDTKNKSLIFIIQSAYIKRK
jgi:hypothetical protein